ncbi:hypothetical protein FCOIX_8995 [Fusarium coicis]|nr:hypothetical protein FCOIX_8995 [Fusarium coicis]
MLNNQEDLSHQVAELTEMVADLKVGPRSRRSSASSRKSGDSNITNLIGNEAVDSFIADEDLFTIFEAFVSETGTPINIRKAKKTLDATHRERKAKGKAKKSVVQTRTESFQTAIDGEDITTQRRGEKPKVPKHLPLAACAFTFLFIKELCEGIGDRVALELKGHMADEVTTKTSGLIPQTSEQVTTPPSDGLTKCVETMAHRHQESADITQKIDDIKA